MRSLRTRRIPERRPCPRRRLNRGGKRRSTRPRAQELQFLPCALAGSGISVGGHQTGSCCRAPSLPNARNSITRNPSPLQSKSLSRVLLRSSGAVSPGASPNGGSSSILAALRNHRSPSPPRRASHHRDDPGGFGKMSGYPRSNRLVGLSWGKDLGVPFAADRRCIGQPNHGENRFDQLTTGR